MAHVSEKGLRLIKNSEGLRLTAYQDAVGVWTIGYGHTGPDVVAGLTITLVRAEALLRGDLQRFERGVESALSRPATQGQFDAMVSLAYNVGVGAFQGSTLRQKFNAGDTDGAAQQFAEFIHAGGAILKCLVRRRASEIIVFCSRTT